LIKKHPLFWVFIEALFCSPKRILTIGYSGTCPRFK